MNVVHGTEAFSENGLFRSEHRLFLINSVFLKPSKFNIDPCGNRCYSNQNTSGQSVEGGAVRWGTGWVGGRV
ncbi:hypothetical protein evm_002169 [Chilo suppressalis]|nr:hypothetical protein evm_002169 [Chilo suppressalis]